MSYGSVSGLLLGIAIVALAIGGMFAADPEGRNSTYAGICFLILVSAFAAWLCLSAAKLLGVWPW